MQGLMMERPLLISAIIKHAAIYHRDTEIVSQTVESGIHRYTYFEAEQRSKKLARALQRAGIGAATGSVLSRGVRFATSSFITRSRASVRSATQ
jgi:fatty-acyl-CoA synthase